MSKYYEEVANGKATSVDIANYFQKVDLNKELGNNGTIEIIKHNAEDYFAVYKSNQSNNVYEVTISQNGEVKIENKISREEFEIKLANGEYNIETVEDLSELPGIWLHEGNIGYLDLPESGDDVVCSVPETIEIDSVKYKISGVYTDAFVGKSYYSIILPNTVKELRESGHHYSDYMITKNLYIPKSLSRIDEDTFSYNGSNIENFYVDLENHIIRDINGVIYSPNGERLIAYPRGRNYISFLTADDTPTYPRIIGKTAFANVGINEFGPEIDGNIIIPDSVITIEEGAFARTGIKDGVILPHNLEELGEYAFSQSTIKSLDIHGKYTSIPANLCKECMLLERVFLDNNVREIGDYAFAYCSNLTTINLPNTLTKIGKSAFRGCNSLETITIPSSVHEIDEDAFVGCSNLTIVFENVNNIWSVGNGSFRDVNFYSVDDKNYILNLNNNALTYYERSTNVYDYLNHYVWTGY